MPLENQDLRAYLIYRSAVISAVIHDFRDIKGVAIAGSLEEALITCGGFPTDIEVIHDGNKIYSVYFPPANEDEPGEEFFIQEIPLLKNRELQELLRLKLL